MKKINEIIDEYSNDKELYEVLKEYYINEKISQEKYDEIVKNVKKLQLVIIYTNMNLLLIKVEKFKNNY